VHVVDPALGSSGVSGRQGRFDGSDRQARGRLMKSLGAGPVELADVASVMQRDDAVAERLLAALIGEGLCELRGSAVVLPG
jgi:A/G-specific adenine glycosylase